MIFSPESTANNCYVYVLQFTNLNSNILDSDNTR
jgi:hypothetical protein